MCTSSAMWYVLLTNTISIQAQVNVGFLFTAISELVSILIQGIDNCRVFSLWKAHLVFCCRGKVYAGSHKRLFFFFFLYLHVCQVERCIYHEPLPSAIGSHWHAGVCFSERNAVFLRGSLCTWVTRWAVPLSARSSRMEEHISGW